MVRRLMAALALLAAAAAGPAAAAQLVVIQSSAPGIEPGQVIDGAETLSVPEGAEIGLITQDGRTIRLEGPYSGAPAIGGGVADETFLSALSSLVAPNADATKALGLTRAAESVVRQPDSPWRIDVSRPGAHCLPPDGKATLWRTDARRRQALWLKHVGSGAQIEVAWAKEAAVLDWPVEIALADGATYLVRLGRHGMKKIVLHQVPDGLASDPHRAVWMARKRCTGQARALLLGTL